MLEDVGDALLAVLGGIVLAFLGGPAGHDEEAGSLKQQQLLGFDQDPQRLQLRLDDGQVRHEVVYDASPRLVQGLVPDGGGERDKIQLAGVSGTLNELPSLLSDQPHALGEDGLASLEHNQVHLVDEDVDLGGGRVLGEGGENGDVGGHVAVDVAGFDVEDVDQDADVGEDVDSLLREVVFHESLLATTVPQIKCKVTEELDMGEIDINSSATAITHG